MVGCSECDCLWRKYVAATNARVIAEADLTAAVFSKDSMDIQRKREATKSALARWKLVAEHFRQHEATHTNPGSAAGVS